MPESNLAPVFFISHGSPMLALDPGALGPALQACSHTLDGVSAIAAVSPHWQTRSLQVSTAEQPETIHDFGGFDPRLYQLQYRAAGAPQAAQLALDRLQAHGLSAQATPQRGMDHGTWIPLLFLRPQADIPVFQISLPHSYDAQAAYQLGLALQPLRQQGIAIIGSGSMTHNLSEFRGADLPALPYVEEFSSWMRNAVAQRDHQALVHYRERAPHAVRAHPSDEHLLPLHLALGASRSDDAWKILTQEARYGMLSTESYLWQA